MESMRRCGRPWMLILLVFVIAGMVVGIPGSNKIRPRKCFGEDGRSGTCMFTMDCQKSDGVPLGVCLDGFLIGSCCGHDDQSNQILRPSSTTSTKKPSTFSSTMKTKKPSTVIFSSATSTKKPSISSSVDNFPTSNTPMWSLITKTTSKTPVRITSSVPTLGVLVTTRPYRPIIRKTTPKIISTTSSSSTAAGPSTIVTTVQTSTTTEMNLQLQKDCGRPRLIPQTRIVNGSKAAFGAWPWQASVRRTTFFGFASTHRCGGAVISDKWIVTAGHCVDDLLLAQIRVRLGEYDFASTTENLPYVERSAQRKIVHPKYNLYTYDNDLALVLLDRALDLTLPHIGPICLPSSDDPLIGKNATIIGWGRLSEGGALPTILQETVVPIVSNQKCRSMFASAKRPENIPDIMMCAGYANGGKDSCQGDSGGPLQVRDDDGKWFLAGIISWGIGCGDPNLPGVCTRISKFKTWIIENTT